MNPMEAPIDLMDHYIVLMVLRTSVIRKAM
jgi:hypothetical protein